MGLANTALLMSVIRGLMSRGLIDQAEAALIEEDKTAFTKSRGEAITVIRQVGATVKFESVDFLNFTIPGSN